MPGTVSAWCAFIHLLLNAIPLGSSNVRDGNNIQVQPAPIDPFDLAWTELM